MTAAGTRAAAQGFASIWQRPLATRLTNAMTSGEHKSVQATLEAIMFEQRLLAGLAAALICLPTIANAQTGSAPGSRERELSQIIREAGYECPQVESITNAPEPPPGWESLRPEIAICRNGKRF